MALWGRKGRANPLQKRKRGGGFTGVSVDHLDGVRKAPINQLDSLNGGPMRSIMPAEKIAPIQPPARGDKVPFGATRKRRWPFGKL